MACALIAFAIFTKRTTPALTVAGVTIACGFIGFVDDWFKLVAQTLAGAVRAGKMLALALVVAATGLCRPPRAPVHRRVCAADQRARLDWARSTTCFLFLVVAGAANAVNLTDGLDGLAAGTCTIAMPDLLAP